MSSIHIYWDESHFWGLLVTRALTAWGVPHRLVRGYEIANGVLTGSDGDPASLLIVPGGRAKGKVDRLGDAGMAAVREFVDNGGTYVGFCGGAGLALTSGRGLDLSPWARKGYKNRLHHFLSGHVHVKLTQAHQMVPDHLGDEALLPVWWPGRFAPLDDEVTVLARYERPGADFWVADINLSTLPKGTMSDWENLYGIDLRPNFLHEQPCITYNTFGSGQVILSYAHLETPASPQANSWLAHILGRAVGMEPPAQPVPAWDVAERPRVWDDPVLSTARHFMENVILTGTSHFQLFWRNPWLLGWRRGIPGASINALYSLICEAMACEPNAKAQAFWERKSRSFGVLIELMGKGLSGYLLAERLASTIPNPDAVPKEGLMEERRALFGVPPEPGGLYADILEILEELYWLLRK